MTKNAMFNLRDYTTADILNTPVRRGGILPVTEYPDRTEFDLSSGLTGALWNAITAPARAARGEITEDQQIPEAFNFAGSLTLGSLLAPRPTGSVGMGGRAANGALDMSDAARMARAKEMGFDTDKTFYHGSRRDDLTEFVASDSETGKGVFTTDNIFTAEDYAKTGDVLAEPDIGATGTNWGGVYPLHTRGKYMQHDAGGADWWNVNMRQIIDDARNQGFDGVDFNNIADAKYMKGMTGNTRVVFDPSNIRSVNAAFDPAKSSSANILAANAKTGAAVPLATRALEAQQPQGIRAFHGSPHDFERFDMSKVGTGEGAQAYGHGLYFAENEGVAKSYKNALGGKLLGPNPTGAQRYLVDGAPLDLNNPEHLAAATARKFGTPDEAAKFLRSEYWSRWESPFAPTDMPGFSSEKAAAKELSERAAQIIEGGKLPEMKTPGHMYEVNIKADPQDFLDWYAPTAGATMERVAPLGVKEGATGYEALQQVAAQLARDGKLKTGKDLSVQVSESLREAGIPGIRYLDQMSRGEGKGSSNYVVFDDALVEILRKYGLLPPVAAGGLAAALGQEDELY